MRVISEYVRVAYSRGGTMSSSNADDTMNAEDEELQVQPPQEESDLETGDRGNVNFRPRMRQEEDLSESEVRHILRLYNDSID